MTGDCGHAIATGDGIEVGCYRCGRDLVIYVNQAPGVCIFRTRIRCTDHPAPHQGNFDRLVEALSITTDQAQ